MGTPKNDSREQLEADCEKLIENIQSRIFSGRDAGALRCQIKELLDRQAAITADEANRIHETGCEACRAAQKRKIAELIAERDELNETIGTLSGECVIWKESSAYWQEQHDILMKAYKRLQRQYDLISDKYKSERIGGYRTRDNH